MTIRCTKCGAVLGQFAHEWIIVRVHVRAHQHRLLRFAAAGAELTCERCGTIWKEPESLRQIVQNALRELRGWQTRYRMYTQAQEFRPLLPVMEALEAVETTELVTT